MDCAAYAGESALKTPNARIKHNKKAIPINVILEIKVKVLEDFIAFPPSSCEVYTTAKRKYTLMLIRKYPCGGKPLRAERLIEVVLAYFFLGVNDCAHIAVDARSFYAYDDNCNRKQQSRDTHDTVNEQRVIGVCLDNNEIA